MYMHFYPPQKKTFSSKLRTSPHCPFSSFVLLLPVLKYDNQTTWCMDIGHIIINQMKGRTVFFFGNQPNHLRAMILLLSNPYNLFSLTIISCIFHSHDFPIIFIEKQHPLSASTRFQSKARSVLIIKRGGNVQSVIDNGKHFIILGKCAPFPVLYPSSSYQCAMCGLFLIDKMERSTIKRHDL
jgi:hypothetical protein